MRDSRKENNRLQMQQNRKQETSTKRKSRQAKYAFQHQKKTEVETPDEKRCTVILNTASQRPSMKQNKNNKRKQPSPQRQNCHKSTINM